MDKFHAVWLILALLIVISPNVHASGCPSEGDDVEITSDCSLDEGTYLYGNLTVKNSATMTVDPNAWVYVIDTLRVEPGSKIDDGNFCIGCTYSPASWIERIEPSYYSPVKSRNYTNQNQFAVYWDAANMAGVTGFDVQYSVEEGINLIQDWTSWISTSEKSKTFGPDSPYSVRNNLTFGFRVREVYSNGSEGLWSTQKYVTIDTEKPLCFLDELPQTSYAEFSLDWEATDLRGSGVKSTEVQFSTGAAPDDWSDIGSICTVTGSSASCTGTPGTTYNFRCRATDYATNTGDFSDTVTTTVTSYIASFLNPLPGWMSQHQTEWSGDRSFTISWGGSYKGIETSCYYVKWKEMEMLAPSSINPDEWNDIEKSGSACLPPDQTAEIFGDDETALQDGKTYAFIIRAKNVMDEAEPWPDPSNPDDVARIASTTVDTVPPDVWDEIKDQDGNPIEGWEVPEGLEKVYINGHAMDEISGIMNASIIKVFITESGFERLETKDCGPAAPGEDVSCSFEAFFGPDTQIKYRTEALDRAGNWNASTGMEGKWKFLVRHPIANFIVHNLFLTLGSRFDEKIQVRNLNDQPVNVTLNISGYDFARFVQAEGDYAITEDRTGITLYNVNPFEERKVDLEILSTDPDEYTLTLDASNTAGETDSDEMHIAINFRAAFSGLTEWAVLVLVFLACMIVYRRKL
jgi:hypothetical protein